MSEERVGLFETFPRTSILQVHWLTKVIDAASSAELKEANERLNAVTTPIESVAISHDCILSASLLAVRSSLLRSTGQAIIVREYCSK